MIFECAICLCHPFFYPFQHLKMETNITRAYYKCRYRVLPSQQYSLNYAAKFYVPWLTRDINSHCIWLSITQNSEIIKNIYWLIAVFAFCFQGCSNRREHRNAEEIKCTYIADLHSIYLNMCCYVFKPINTLLLKVPHSTIKFCIQINGIWFCCKPN